MRVVGGCYEELVTFPNIAQWFGSGLRAAAVLRSLGEDVSLVTAIDDASRAAAGGTAAAFAVPLEAQLRTGPVSFVYATPVSVPTMYGVSEADVTLNADADSVVAFGMLDATWRVNTGKLVVDPQGTHDLDKSGLAASTWDELVIVANARETRQLGVHADIPEAARAVLGRNGARAVITKRAMLGVTVVADGVVATIPSYETPRVQPLGSGDVFSAAFAHAWATLELPIIEAAEYASLATASYAFAGDPALGQVDPAHPPFKAVRPRPVRLYLAAPFFTPAQRWLVETVRTALHHLEIDVFSPVHDVGWTPTDAVAIADISGLEGCDGVIALLDDADPGTIFETGWACAHDMPVVGVCTDTRQAAKWTMLRGTGGLITDDLSTAVYASAWRAMDREQ